MKVVILAGGKGTRLGKITERLPKPLVRIGNVPVLEHQIKLLISSGFKEVWLLTGHQGELIEEYFKNKRLNVKIYFSREIIPLGTAGVIKSIASELTEDFLVLYGDMMVNFNVQRFIKFHRQHSRNSLATIIVCPTDHPYDSDLVEVKDDKVVNFFPKPHSPEVLRHKLANAAIYILSPKIFSFIPKDQKIDLDKQILPWLLDKGKGITAYKSNEYLQDMGTPDRLKTARKDYKSGKYHSFNPENKTGRSGKLYYKLEK